MKKAKYILFLIFIIILSAFNFRESKTGGWYLQNLPALNNNTIKDMVFVDSLTGFIATNAVSSNAYILKTTNGGDNWFINKTNLYEFSSISFCDSQTGFADSFDTLYKTTNKGVNWIPRAYPMSVTADKIFALNPDTVWIAGNDGMHGGLYITTNSGISWTQKFQVGPIQMDNVYFYNKLIGFATDDYNLSNLYKTTNGGENWSIIPGGWFSDIYFADSLLGWKAGSSFKRTTDGGNTWQTQTLPVIPGAIGTSNGIKNFSKISKDTIYGAYASVTYNTGTFGFIYKTTNQGVNWGYQFPDTSFHINRYYFIDFINKNIGWAYHMVNKGIHTTIGGNDTTFYTSINNITQIPPKNFELKQNYPNPYNNTSLIEYYINEPGRVKLKIFDMSGREIATLVNEEQSTGGYGVPVSVPLSSGVYFYKFVFVNRKGEMQMDTKKMVVIK